VKRHILSILSLALGLASAGANADFSNRQDVRAFIDKMVDEHAFSRSDLVQTFAAAKKRSDILEAISRPAESKPWHQYRPIFLGEDRIKGGVRFWKAHADALERAEREYGVPPHIIVAILGVETRFGKHAGGYRVIDALSTLAFDYPPRSGFFRGQLEQYLLMAREEKISPLSLKGSYAGAMGQPQFIPSSFRTYAVDFDGDGRRDLWEDVDDVIGSVANYFHRHGWEPGEGIAYRARVEGDRYGELVDRGVEPKTAAGKLADYGVSVDANLAPDTPVSLIELEQRDGPEYWVTRNNFYVITRYNHSSLYAMAVHQLSQAIRAGMK
jgi:membrane-bound lytic murein transglycosylase B